MCIFYAFQIKSFHGQSVNIYFSLFYSSSSFFLSFNATLEKLQELIDSARVGNTVNIQKVASEGFNLNTQDEDGWTALHHAAKMKQDKVVELLISLGVNQALRNNIGQTCQDIITEVSLEECF